MAGKVNNGGKKYTNPTEYNRILFLGNSITLHESNPDIGWPVEWGMAASSQDKDCVHLIAEGLRRKDGSLPEVMIHNVAGFERNFDSFDASVLVRECRAFKPDLIIIGIGENIQRFGEDLSVHIKDPDRFNSYQPFKDTCQKASSSPHLEAQSLFRKKTVELLKDICEETSGTSIFIRSCFWIDRVKDIVLKIIAKDLNAKFVSLGNLGDDETNLARSEKEFECDGVGAHPGDKGMREIADCFLKAIKNACVCSETA